MTLSKKSGILLVVMGVAAMCMGCGASIPEMTEQEQVVEYAAHLLLKYDKNHGSKLVDLEELEEEAPKTEELSDQEAPSDQDDPSEDGLQETNADDDTEVIDETGSAVASAAIEDFFALDGLKFTYKGHQVTDSYPSEMEGMLIYPAINAVENCDLFVVEFGVTVTGDSSVDLNMVHKNARFKISMNDGPMKNALVTMLLNDLATYQGTVEPGEEVLLAAVFEYKEAELGTVESLVLRMQNENDSALMVLE